MNVTQQLEPAKVVGPDETPSYWQPVPANGFIRNIFSQASVGSKSNVSIGTQTLPPGCFIREHTHAKQEEIIYVVEGKGVARIDGVEQPLEKGARGAGARQKGGRGLSVDMTRTPPSPTRKGERMAWGWGKGCGRFCPTTPAEP